MTLNINHLSAILQPYIKSLKYNQVFGAFEKAFVINRFLFYGDYDENNNEVLIFIDSNNESVTFLVIIKIEDDESYEILSISMDESDLLKKLRNTSAVITKNSIIYYLDSDQNATPKLKIINGNKKYLVDVNSNFNENDYKEIPNI